MRQRHGRGGASAGFPVLLLMCGIALGGCVTHVARVPGVPDITAVPVLPEAPIIGIARVRDRRLNDVAGYIGVIRKLGDPVVAGAGFVDYLYVSLFKGLYDQGFSPVSAPGPVTGLPPGFFKAKVVVATLQSLEIEVPGSGIAQATAHIFIEVYDETDRSVYSHSFHGGHTGFTGFDLPRNLGAILAAAMDQAVGDAMRDAAFLAAVQ